MTKIHTKSVCNLKADRRPVFNFGIEKSCGEISKKYEKSRKIKENERGLSLWKTSFGQSRFWPFCGKNKFFEINSCFFVKCVVQSNHVA